VVTVSNSDAWNSTVMRPAYTLFEHTF
jgi:hypothetical protein